MLEAVIMAWVITAVLTAAVLILRWLEKRQADRQHKHRA